MRSSSARSLVTVARVPTMRKRSAFSRAWSRSWMSSRSNSRDSWKVDTRGLMRPASSWPICSSAPSRSSITDAVTSMPWSNSSRRSASVSARQLNSMIFSEASGWRRSWLAARKNRDFASSVASALSRAARSSASRRSAAVTSARVSVAPPSSVAVMEARIMRP